MLDSWRKRSKRNSEAVKSKRRQRKSYIYGLALSTVMVVFFSLGYLGPVSSASAFVVSKPLFKPISLHTLSVQGSLFVMKRKSPGSPSSSSRLLATFSDAHTAANQSAQAEELVPLYRSEGIFAVEKPLEWTSNDVVVFLRGILEREARARGAKPVKVNSRRSKNRTIRVGHGGALDPLASGVLVIGVGKGTKALQSYLSGSKQYTAKGKCGFETTTLDICKNGNVTETAPYDHVTAEMLRDVLPSFTGKIMQVPPIFSAIRKDGKRMYKMAREGKTADDMKMEAREVEIFKLELLDAQIPDFELNIECGGGTYVRSLIRDIGRRLDTVATMTALKRTRQGHFTTENVLEKSDWSPDNIYAAIDRSNEQRQNEAVNQDTK